MATTAFPRIPFFSTTEPSENGIANGSSNESSNGSSNGSVTSPQAIPWDSLTEVAARARKTERAGKILGEKAATVVADLSTEEAREFLRGAFFLASLSDKKIE